MARVHIDVLCHVDREELVLGVVAEHPHQRRIGGHELAVGRGLEDPRRHVLEKFAVALLRGLEGLQRVGALRRVAQHLVEQLRRDLVLDQVVERATVDRIAAEVVVGRVRDDDHRDLRSLGLDTQEGREAQAVGQVEVEQDGVDASQLEARKAVGERTRGFQPERRPADSGQRLADPGVVILLRSDEEHCGGHRWPEYTTRAAGESVRYGRVRPGRV